MLKNYAIIVLRNLRKHRIYAFINVVGLAVAIACCVLIGLFAIDEWSYDLHHAQGDRIYRVAVERVYEDNEDRYALTPKSLAEKLPEYSEIAEVTRFRDMGNPLVWFADKQFVENRFLWADSNFFEVFTVPFLEGDPKTALIQPNSVVLTEETAHRYFGDENAMGQTLDTDYGAFTVTGIVESPPLRSHFHFDFIASLTTGRFLQLDNWIGLTVYTYLVLQPGSSADALEDRFPEMVERYASKHIENWLGLPFDEAKASGLGYHYFLQPLRDIHLRSHLENEVEPNGHIGYVTLFIAIGILILSIACINFMNLETARLSDRAREVGIRKVLGSGQNHLVGRFLGEALAMSGLALLLALLLVEAILPHFNTFTGKNLDLRYLDSLALPILIGFAILVALLAGSYPAFFFANISPAIALKGSLATGTKRATLRNGLVIFQFAISIVLLVCTAIIYAQMDYIRAKHLGFDKEHILVLERVGSLQQQRKAFQETLLSHAGIVNVSGTNAMPGNEYNGMTLIPEGASTTINMNDFIVDFQFFETMGIPLRVGRSFSEYYATDSLYAILINRTAARRLGWPDPIGKSLTLASSIPATAPTFTIIGVVEDFHFYSLHEQVGPLMIRSPDQIRSRMRYLCIRIRPEGVQNTLAFIEETWQAFAPAAPFRFSFVDDRLNTLYRTEQRTGRLLGTFSMLALVIACSGLWGLATYTTARRTREIGIRKVLGASSRSIAFLLSKDFFVLVLVAFVLASPIAFFAMNKWLQEFAFRLTIPWWLFPAVGLLTLFIAWLTVSYQSIKAARTNPVETLRYE